MKSEESEPWSPGRAGYWITTVIAAVGMGTGIFSAYRTSFYHPPITVESTQAEFSALSYSEQLDQCVPYIKDNLDDWFTEWRTGLEEFIRKFPDNDAIVSMPTMHSEVDDLNASPQDIVNTISAIVNYARTSASASVGKNLMACINGPSWQQIADKSQVSAYVNTVVGTGNASPSQMDTVTRFSPIYYTGFYAGVPANTLPNRVIESASFNENHQTDLVQRGFKMAEGTRKGGVKMWVVFATVLSGEKKWVESLEMFRGGF